jgi:hypothetical protein
MALNKNKAGYVTSTASGSISSTNVQDALEELDSEKAPKASPALTGSPTAPTPSSGNNSTAIATTAFVRTRETGLQSSIDLKAPLASPALTGDPTAPTQAAGNDSTRIANTAFVQAALASVDRTLVALKTSSWVNGTNTISEAWDDFEQIIVVHSALNSASGLTQQHMHDTFFTDLIFPYDSASPASARLTSSGSHFDLSFGDTDRTKIYITDSLENDRMVAMYGRYRK